MTRPQLTCQQRSRILSLSAAGKSIREIQRILAQDGVQKSPDAICTVVNSKRVTRKVGSGRPRATAARTDSRFVALTRKNRRITLYGIQQETGKVSNSIDSAGASVSLQTISNRLRATGISSRRPKVKPLLTQRHKEQRLSWARKHQSFTESDWQHVLWTDECPIPLRQRDNSNVWRREGDAVSLNLPIIIVQCKSPL